MFWVLYIINSIIGKFVAKPVPIYYINLFKQRRKVKSLMVDYIPEVPEF